MPYKKEEKSNVHVLIWPTEGAYVGSRNEIPVHCK
jgi:hypothetical protein